MAFFFGRWFCNRNFFMVFDPNMVLEAGGFDDISLLGAYTIAFFLSWLSMMICCLLTAYFARPCEKICEKYKSEQDKS